MRKQKIEDLIRAQFPKLRLLEIDDESHKHAGRQGQESHFKVLLVSEDFNGQTRVQRQRQINELLKEEFSSGLHALSLRILTPEELSKAETFQSPNCHK
ncbi:MAG: BolA family transcriptional regulator [Bdellovibrionales bacterium]|nr:BolA family transcriptional regulator [Bdellovibrionales bacterium]